MIYDEELSTGPAQEMYKKLEGAVDVYNLLAAIEISKSELVLDPEEYKIVKVDLLFCLAVKATFDLKLIDYADFEDPRNGITTSRPSIDNWRMEAHKGRMPDPLRAPANHYFRLRVIDFILNRCLERVNAEPSAP